MARLITVLAIACFNLFWFWHATESEVATDIWHRFNVDLRKLLTSRWQFHSNMEQCTIYRTAWNPKSFVLHSARSCCCLLFVLVAPSKCTSIWQINGIWLSPHGSHGYISSWEFASIEFQPRAKTIIILLFLILWDVAHNVNSIHGIRIRCAKHSNESHTNKLTWLTLIGMLHLLRLQLQYTAPFETTNTIK